MCICINCQWVDRCQAYHAVETQHGVPHLNENPDMTPSAPKIHINVLDLADGGTGVEWDIRKCNSFLKDHGRWMRLRPGKKLPR